MSGSRLAIVAVLTAAAVRTLPAQASCATVPIQAQDLCTVTTDMFQYVVPQLSVALVGGNGILGQGGVVGGLPGLPHVTVGGRTTFLVGNLPTIQTPSTTGS